MNRKQQEYWSLIAYDIYGLPLPQYVYDANVREIPVTPSPSSSKTSSNERNDDVYRYSIRITANSSASTCTNPNSDSTHTDLDVTKAPRGYLMFRRVHPSTNTRNVSPVDIQVDPHAQDTTAPLATITVT